MITFQRLPEIFGLKTALMILGCPGATAHRHLLATDERRTWNPWFVRASRERIILRFDVIAPHP
jgi:hypothetical protein